MATTFILPELGENIESGSVTKVLVAVGDAVVKDQPVIELETDKAVLDVPCPFSGTIIEIHAKEGADLRVGDIILVMENGVLDDAPVATERAEPRASEIQPAPAADVPLDGGQQVPGDDPGWDAPAVPMEADLRQDPRPPTPKRTVSAPPSVRRLAREIGVDVQDVTPSAPSGRVSKEDVKAYARERSTDSGALTSPAARQGHAPLPDFTRWGEVERQEMSTVRRKTAEHMAAAWAAIPHVTQHDNADITRLEKLRQKYGPKAEAQGGKLTPTAIIVKVLASALKKFPQFNASVDVEKNEIILKHYYNIGVAVDTDRGLLVPVIKNVDQKNIIDISVELSQLAERARNRKVTLEEMQGGCITVTNLGGIGGTGFTPIVNAPEVAILGVSRSSVQPVYEDGQFVPRTLLPLSLSYDHRIIDGADAARFTRWVCEALEEPFLLFLEG